ncbi:hypothetical protein ASF61_05495 [Duganella sp. Leaf126]|uniref:hypothetical protein n=1 Tax=Duganella sp. Leaf126 TaxID=1736266 RepID=UPI0006F1ED03|nr:hypothetical protein [Duganella sp. Leaf126]KQQ40233.1 hypothetical protein ASF61_05495 [Duganella sp. Leaf126]
MSQANKRGFKPGANMPHDDYDPMEQGMSESGNHAVGHPGNDNPTSNHHTNQHGRQPARSEQSVREGNMGRSYYDSKQAASAAAAQTTHRYNAAGARADGNTGKGR